MVITVAGSGYVGLTTSACLASLGHEVRCVDVDGARVDAINRGEAPFYEPGLADALAAARARGTLAATTDLARAVASSALTFIAVGTPPARSGIDLSQVAAAAAEVGAALRGARGYHVVVVKSTVVPGTTEGLVRRAIEQASGRAVGAFGLCMNPEFLREGSAMADFLSPDRIVIGSWDEASAQPLLELYERLPGERLLTTLAGAELIKYASNTLLATLISYSNEIAAICERTPGADVTTVLRGVQLDRRLTPVVGGRRVEPGILAFLAAGCGFGGSCLPKDLDALRAYARERGVESRLLNAVAAVNAAQPLRLHRLVREALGGLQGTEVAVLGLTFKPGTEDVRESPAFPVIDALRGDGAGVRVYDPMLRPAAASRAAGPGAWAAPSLESALEGADAAVIVTAHAAFAEFPWERAVLLMRQPVVVDGRNLLRGLSLPERLRYTCVGRTPYGGGCA